MALVVFEMGQRITTPIKGGHARVAKTSKTESTHAINQTDPHFAQVEQAYSPPERKQQHQPKPVAYLGEIMTREVLTISPDEYVETAWQIFNKVDFHHLPVVNQNNKILAMLSKVDILINPDNLKNILDQPVMKFSNRQVFCFTYDSDIRQATKIMSEYNLGALPVIDEHGSLQGIVSRSDILKVLSHYGPLELWV